MRMRGEVPVSGLTVVLGWNIARGQARLVVADDDDPGDLDFSSVAALEVLFAVDSSKHDIARRDAAVRSILRGDPAVLIEIDMGVRPHPLRFIKTKAAGIEQKEFFQYE
jgi:hypothetical protein